MALEQWADVEDRIDALMQGAPLELRRIRLVGEGPSAAELQHRRDIRRCYDIDLPTDAERSARGCGVIAVRQPCDVVLWETRDMREELNDQALTFREFVRSVERELVTGLSSAWIQAAPLHVDQDSGRDALIGVVHGSVLYDSPLAA